MTVGILIAVMIGSLLIGGCGVWLFVSRQSAPGTKKKPAKKKAAPWMTTNQLEVLQAIADQGKSGILFFETNLNAGTIRSLAKRGMVDTAPKLRIVATEAGKRRLRQPWPSEPSTGDQKDRTGSDGVGETRSVEHREAEGV